MRPLTLLESFCLGNNNINNLSFGTKLLDFHFFNLLGFIFFLERNEGGTLDT